MAAATLSYNSTNNPVADRCAPSTKRGRAIANSEVHGAGRFDPAPAWADAAAAVPSIPVAATAHRRTLSSGLTVFNACEKPGFSGQSQHAPRVRSRPAAAARTGVKCPASRCPAPLAPRPFQVSATPTAASSQHNFQRVSTVKRIALAIIRHRRTGPLPEPSHRPPRTRLARSRPRRRSMSHFPAIPFLSGLLRTTSRRAVRSICASRAIAEIGRAVGEPDLEGHGWSVARRSRSDGGVGQADLECGNTTGDADAPSPWSISRT